MVSAIDDPSVLWDVYCDRMDMIRKAELEEGTCEQCIHYNSVPDNWSKIECGWCSIIEDFVEGCDSVTECEDTYEPRY